MPSVFLSGPNLALAAAVSWGASDFAGGVATRRASPFFIVLIAHGVSLLSLLVAILIVHAPLPSWHFISIGLCAGVAGGLGLAAFYRALTLGPMGLTASVAGLLTASVPVLFSFLSQGLPKPVQLAGFAVAVPAIWFVANPKAGTANPKALWLGAVAGIGFGVLLTLLNYSSQGGVLWALAMARIASTVIATTLVVVKEKPKAPSLGLFGFAAATGLLDLAGNTLYTLSTRVGRMDIAAVLSSLYPAVTIFLAALFLKERATRVQIAGMLLALAAVALISL